MPARISWLGRALCAAVVCVSLVSAATAQSTGFDTSLEGWTANTLDEVHWASVDGNPGGYARFEDSAGTGAWLSAPSDYLGDLSGLSSGGWLAYDHRILDAGSVREFNAYEIRMSGPGGSALWSGGRPTGAGGWSRVYAPIAEPQWNVESGTWSELLRDVDSLQIRIEMVNNAGSPMEVSGIDNVRVCPTPRRLFSNVFASDDDVLFGIDFDGHANAAMISTVLDAVPNSHRLTHRVYESDSVDDVSADMADYPSACTEAANPIRPEDTYVFVYTGHAAKLVGTDIRALAPTAGTLVYSSDLLSWFGGDEWQDVNKIFVLDSCYAGGIGEDLLTLSNTAVFGACLANEETAWDLDNLSMFSKIFRDAIAMDGDGFTFDTNGNGLSIAELAAALGSRFELGGGWEGTLLDELKGISPHLYAQWSSDVDPSETWLVPEPATLSLLALGGLAVIRKRRQSDSRTGALS